MADTSYMAHLGRLQVAYQGDRDTALNTWFFTSDGVDGASEADLLALATAMHAVWVTYWKPLAVDNLSVIWISAADWSSDEGHEGVYNGSIDGSLDDDPLPAQVAMLINYTEPLRYKGGHPRTYLPGGGAAQLADNQNWTEAFWEAIGDFATNFLAILAEQTLGGDPVTPVCYHARYKDESPFATVIEDSIAEYVPATQRRRVRRAGHEK